MGIEGDTFIKYGQDLLPKKVIFVPSVEGGNLLLMVIVPLAHEGLSIMQNYLDVFIFSRREVHILSGMFFFPSVHIFSKGHIFVGCI